MKRKWLFWMLGVMLVAIASVNVRIHLSGKNAERTLMLANVEALAEDEEPGGCLGGWHLARSVYYEGIIWQWSEQNWLAKCFFVGDCDNLSDPYFCVPECDVEYSSTKVGSLYEYSFLMEWLMSNECAVEAFQKMQ